MIQLETQRLYLRNGSEERPTDEELRRDYRRYVIEHEDPSVTFSQYEDENIYAFLNARRGSVFGYYVIFPKGLDKWVGHCSFYPLVCRPDMVQMLDDNNVNPYSSIEFEIGWAISKDFRNRGYATEGARALLDYGFNELNAKRIIALTEHGNTASIRIMEKIGMSLHYYPTVRSIVGVVYAKTRAQS